LNFVYKVDIIFSKSYKAVSVCMHKDGCESRLKGRVWFNADPNED